MELLFVAIILGIVCMLFVILFCAFSRQKEGAVYCQPSSGRKTSKGSIKACNIDGFMK